MLTLFVVLFTWSTVAGNSFFQVATPPSAEQKVTATPDDLNVDEYLRKYGYMNDVNERSDDYVERRADAIRLFQEFAGLEVTGETNEETRELMLKPRCGVKDIEIGRPENGILEVTEETNEETQELMLKPRCGVKGIEIGRPENARWNISELTYKFTSYSNDLSESDTRAAIADALSVWEGPSKLKFKKITSGDPIMELRFVSRKHKRCPYAFDGAGGVAAHAYGPSKHRVAGDIHFDIDEPFMYKKGKGLSLVSVALHESGHALGLGHDNKKGEVMAGWYTGLKTLGPNDTKRIKELYK